MKKVIIVLLVIALLVGATVYVLSAPAGQPQVLGASEYNPLATALEIARQMLYHTPQSLLGMKPSAALPRIDR